MILFSNLFAMNINCRYLLELPHCGDSNNIFNFCSEQKEKVKTYHNFSLENVNLQPDIIALCCTE